MINLRFSSTKNYLILNYYWVERVMGMERGYPCAVEPGFFLFFFLIIQSLSFHLVLELVLQELLCCSGLMKNTMLSIPVRREFCNSFRKYCISPILRSCFKIYSTFEIGKCLIIGGTFALHRISLTTVSQLGET